MSGAPPLKIWVIVIALAVSIYGAFYFNVASNPRVFDELDKKTEWLLKHHIASCPDSTVTVIVLGSSLVQAGISQKGYFEKEAVRLFGRDLRVFKIYEQSAYLKQFTDHSNVFNLLIKYPPDILFIEENLIGYHVTRARDYNFLMYETLRSFYVNNKKAILEIPYEIPFQEPIVNRGSNELTDTLHLQDYLNVIANRKVKSFEENKTLNAYLAQLKQKGTAVIMLNFPRPHPVEANIHSGEKEVQFQKLKQIYQQNYGIDYWQFENPVPFNHFYDFGHLNEKGEKVFSNWLLKEIGKKF